MRLDGIRVGAEPGALERLGLHAPGGRAVVGGVTIEAAAGEGILGLDLRGAPDDGPLPLVEVPAGPGQDESGVGHEQEHVLGATAVDHVVVLAGDVEAAIAALGVEPRRVEVRDGRRYGFVVADTALLEFVGPEEVAEQAPRLWGLALTVADLQAAATHLGGAAGEIRAAVQPGRQILTVRHEQLGLHVPTVLLTPRA